MTSEEIEDDGYITVNTGEVLGYTPVVRKRGVEVYGDNILFNGVGVAEITVPSGPLRDEFMDALDNFVEYFQEIMVDDEVDT